MKVGSAKYGTQYTKKKYFKLKDGESTFRILPPLGELADEGRWSQYYKIHYGYKNKDGALRPFESPLVENRKTKMIEVPDAALERIKLMKAKFEEAKKTGNQDLIKVLDKMVGQKGQYNLDANHYMNVIDEAGNIGVLKIRHRAKNALDATIKRLRDSGVDPLSPNDGRFFVFRRSGMGPDTAFQVDVKKEKLSVQGVGVVERDIVHVLTPEIIGRLATEAAELNKLFKKPTAEEVAEIVRTADQDGKSTKIDEIFASKQGNDTDDYDDGDDSETGTTSTPSATSLSTATAAPATPVQAPVTTTPTQAATPVTPSAVPEAVQVAVAPKVESLTPTKTTAQAVGGQTNEEFLKSIGLA